MEVAKKRTLAQHANYTTFIFYDWQLVETGGTYIPATRSTSTRSSADYQLLATGNKNHFFKSLEEGNFKSSPLRTTAYQVIFLLFSFTFKILNIRYTCVAPCVSEHPSFNDFSKVLVGILYNYHSFAMKGDVFYYNNLIILKNYQREASAQ